MQDEIVAHLARQLDTALISAEARRAAKLPQPDSMDLYFQGMAWANKGITLHHLAQAGDFFERALALAPDDVGALTGKAWVEMTLASAYTTDDRTARLDTARAALTRALYLAQTTPWPIWSWGVSRFASTAGSKPSLNASGL